MISLSSLSPWTSLHALETAREAGYTGTPFEPLECYRQALWKKMQETQSRRGDTPSKVYLTAKAAFAASEVLITSTNCYLSEIDVRLA